MSELKTYALTVLGLAVVFLFFGIAARTIWEAAKLGWSLVDLLFLLGTVK